VLYLFLEYLRGEQTTKQHVVNVLVHGEAEGTWGGAPSENQQRWDWSDAGLAVQQPLISDVEAGIDRVKEAFKDGRLFVFQSCTGIIEEGGSYSRKLDEQGLPMDEIKDKGTYHRLDALRYVLPGALSAAGAGVVSYKYA